MEPVELPLFLTHEEPILGRLTPRALGLVAGSALSGLIVIALDWWPLVVTGPLASLLVGLCLLEASLRYQGQRPAWWLAHWLVFILRPRTWVWQRPVAVASRRPSRRRGAFVSLAPASLEPVWRPLAVTAPPRRVP